MPVYEYEHKESTDCEFKEAHQRITEDSYKTCPSCGKEIHRIISKTSDPKFKGTGFYATDYK